MKKGDLILYCVGQENKKSPLVVRYRWVNNTAPVSTLTSLLITHLQSQNVLYPSRSPQAISCSKNIRGLVISARYFFFFSPFFFFIGFVRGPACRASCSKHGLSKSPELLHSQQSNWGGSPKGSSHTAQPFATVKLKWQRSWIVCVCVSTHSFRNGGGQNVG